MAGLTGLDRQQGNYNYGQALDKIRQHTKDEKADIMDKPMDDEALKALIAQDILKHYGLGALEMFLLSGAAKGASNAAKDYTVKNYDKAMSKVKDLNKESDAWYWESRRLEESGDLRNMIPAAEAKTKEWAAKRDANKLMEEADDTRDVLSSWGAITKTPSELLTNLIPGATNIAAIARSLNEDETKKAAREANRKWLNKNTDDYRKKAGEAGERLEDGEQKKRILNYSLGKGKLLPEDIETIRTERASINKGE